MSLVAIASTTQEQVLYYIPASSVGKAFAWALALALAFALASARCARPRWMACRLNTFGLSPACRSHDDSRYLLRDYENCQDGC